MGPETVVFVVTQLGDEESAERERADQVLDFVISPAAELLGLGVSRADLDPSPGPITDRIIRSLSESDVVICDLTGRNPNVYYELGIAHTLGRPVVLLVDSLPLPFDVQNESVLEIGSVAGALTARDAAVARDRLVEILELVLDPSYVPESAVANALEEASPLPPDLHPRPDRDFPLYKTTQFYRFEVVDVSAAHAVVRLSISYSIVNPGGRILSYSFSLTPMRPATYRAANVNCVAEDLDDPEIHTARGLVIPWMLPPESTTDVYLEADVTYGSADTDTFLSYIPCQEFALEVVQGTRDLRFMLEALMPRRAIKSQRGPTAVVYEAPDPVLAYQGFRLDWVKNDAT